MSFITDAVLEDIRRRLPPQDVVNRVLTPARQRPGLSTYCCAFHNERNASMDAINKPGKRFIYCHGCGWSGDIFKFVQEYYGKTFREAAVMLADLAGVDLDPAVRRGADQDRHSGHGAAARRDKFQGDADLAAQEAKRAARVRDLWRQTHPAAASPAETYLRWRGYRGAIPADLRFHPGVWYRPEDGEDRRQGRKYPALISRIVGPDGRGRAIHITYLQPDGQGKAPLARAKKVLGARRGGAIWIAGAALENEQVVAEPTILLVEGIESALRVRDALWVGPASSLSSAAPPLSADLAAHPDSPTDLAARPDSPTDDPGAGACRIEGQAVAVCCVIDIGGMSTVELPAHTREVILCAENDMAHADLDADTPRRDARDQYQRAVLAHCRAGRNVRIATAPIGCDFDDLAGR